MSVAIKVFTNEVCPRCEQIYSRLNAAGYSVEKVNFESWLADKTLDSNYRTRAYTVYSAQNTLPVLEIENDIYSIEGAEEKLGVSFELDA